jgi:O-antigen/teichoic acid export membrane protein
MRNILNGLLRYLRFDELIAKVVWSSAGAILVRLTGLGNSIFVSRQLGAEKFGEYIIIQGTVIMLGTIIGQSVGAVGSKKAIYWKKNKNKKNQNDLISSHLIAMIGGSVMFLLVIQFADWIAGVILERNSISKPLWFSAASVFFIAVDTYQMLILSALGSLKKSIIYSGVATVFGAFVAIFTTYTSGLTGAVSGLTIVSFFQFIASAVLLRDILVDNGICMDGKMLSGIRFQIVEIFPILMGTMIVSVIPWFVQISLFKTKNGASDLAVLAIGIQWNNIALFLPNAFGRIMLPALSEHVCESWGTNLLETLKKSILINLIGSLPIVFSISALSPIIMRSYGFTDPGAPVVLFLMMLSALASAACSPAGLLLTVSGKNWIAWSMNLGWGIMYYTFTYLLIGRGALGVAGGWLCAYLIHSVWVFTWLYYQVLKKKP